MVVQCKLCKTGVLPGTVLGLVGPVVVQRQVLVFDSAENCGSSTVAALGQGRYWIVCYSWGEYLYEVGYVRMAFSALNVESQCWLSCRTPEARGDSTGAVLGQGQY